MEEEWHIVAYAGRAVNDNQSPRYLFPKNFKKSQNLFNIQSIYIRILKSGFVTKDYTGKRIKKQ